MLLHGRVPVRVTKSCASADQDGPRQTRMRNPQQRKVLLLDRRVSIPTKSCLRIMRYIEQPTYCAEKCRVR